MKKLTILLFSLSLALGALCLWQWTHSDLRVKDMRAELTKAEDRAEEFDLVAEAVRSQSLLGTVYHADALSDIGRCRFCTITLTLQNRGLLPAEMTELQLTPFAGDVCSWLSRGEIIIPPGETREVSITLLTAQSGLSSRDVLVTWYVWGHPMRLRATLGLSDYSARLMPTGENVSAMLKNLLSGLFCPSALALEEDALPEGFVHVRDLIPDVIEQMRYFGDENFVGTTVDGYLAPAAILTREAALALQKAADAAREKGYRLLIFDAYRPQSAVDHFLRWAADPYDVKTQAHYYPDIKNKEDILKKGYVAAHSGHSRGSTVDLTLATPDGQPLPMGTDFDWFGPRAAHGASGLTRTERENRQLLRRLMEAAGFSAYSAEWWHYTLKHEPFPGTYFNFPVR